MTEHNIRPATEGAAKASAIEVTRLAFAPDEEPTKFLARRLASLRRHSATPWVLEANGRTVSSLLAYPLSFQTGSGEELNGVGLGAVGTDPQARKQGYAEALCRHVVEEAEQRGAPMALLFSAIPPALYERVGFRTCGAWDLVTDDLEGLAAFAPALDWRPIDPRREVADLSRIYTSAHLGQLHLQRDKAAWQRSLNLIENHLWFGSGTPLSAYARCFPKDEKLLVAEVLCESGTKDEMARALAGLARLGLSWDCKRLLTWLHPEEVPASLFHDLGRSETLPMLRGCAETDAPRLWPSDYF